MILFSCVLWEPNEGSFDFSRMYDESWVEKLYRGFARNTTRDFHFIVHVDKLRKFKEPRINQNLLSQKVPSYAQSCIEPYKFGQPMVLVGLDTVITGNIDHLVDYCLNSHRLAVPLDPYNPAQHCNGVALVPRGFQSVWEQNDGSMSDMEWIRCFNPDTIDTLFPRQVVSYKGHVKPRGGIGDARIVYFHGEDKPHQLPHLSWIKENWI